MKRARSSFRTEPDDHKQAGRAGPAPGKTTRSQSLPPLRDASRAPAVTAAPRPGARVDSMPGTVPYLDALQLAYGDDGGGALRDVSAHEHAARGTGGSGTALPHLDAIQHAFGDHDVTDVKAHVGGAASEASEAMGAEAYAMGTHVAFRDAPDLHTAAHEAAHVVQQRRGVTLDGGMGQRGDSYERHADAVADAVVAGESAQPLLEQVPAQQARPGAGPVESAPDEMPPAAPPALESPPDAAPPVEEPGQPEAGEAAAPDEERAGTAQPDPGVTAPAAAAPEAAPAEPGPAAPAKAGVAQPVVPGVGPIAGELASTPPADLPEQLAAARSRVAEARVEREAVLAPAPENSPAPETRPRASTMAAPLPRTAGSRARDATSPEAIAGEQERAGRDHLNAQEIPLSAGPRPQVPLVGAANPAQVGMEATDQLAHADALCRHGEDRIRADAHARSLDVPPPLDIPALPRTAQAPIVLPEPPADDVPASVRDAVESGRAADLLSQARPEATAELAPMLAHAADVQLQTTMHEELAAFRELEQAHCQEAERVRVETEVQMQADLAAVEAQTYAARDEAQGRLQVAQDEFLRSNREAEASLQSFAATRQAEVQGSIAETVSTSEQQAGEVLSRGEEEAARIRSAAEAEAAALLASAEQTDSAPVQRQDDAGEDTRPLHDADLAAIRAAAREILEGGLADASDTLQNAQGEANEETTNAATTLAEQIKQYRAQLEAYQETIAGQMALNGAVLQEEINGAFADYDRIMADCLDEEGNLLPGKEADFITLWNANRETIDVNSETIEESLICVMDRIDAKANLLEPMYAYGAGGAFTDENVQWTMINTEFMSNATGYNAGDIYFPYHDNARSTYDAATTPTGISADVDNGLFPWEGIAAVATAEHRQLHPAAQGLSSGDVSAFGNYWIPESMGIYQTSLMRSNPQEWGNFPMGTLQGMDGYSGYATAYASPNTAALWPGQYASPVFLADFGGVDPAADLRDRRGIAEDFYALAATMYFTGAYIDLPYNSFVHRNTDDNLRGQDTDRAGFNNWGDSEFNYLGDDMLIPDPRVSEGAFNDDNNGVDVMPQHLGATDCTECQGVVSNVPSSSQGLRLRSGPGGSYPATTALSNGTNLTILYSHDGWYYVQVGGSEGWVSDTYVTQN